MKLVPIPTDLLDKVWKIVQSDITAAFEFSGSHTDAEFVLKMLKENRFQLWVVWDKDAKGLDKQYNGVVVTEIVQRKLKKSCHIFIMTGKGRNKWQHLISVIEDFAQQNNCDGMEIISRPGWQKILQNFNYKRTHIVLEKKLKKKTKEE